MEAKNKVASGAVKKHTPATEGNTAATVEPEERKVAKPAFRIQSAKARKRYMNGMFYGDYGTGKSTLAATASEVPEMKHVLFVNAEAGDESIKHMDLDLIDVSNFGQFARVHEFLRLHCKLRDQWLNDKDEEAKKKLLYYEMTLKGLEEGEVTEPTLYHTVIIDSLTEVQKYCMYQLLGIQVGQYALDLAPESPQWDEWGKSAEMMRLLVRTFRDLPIHVFMVCGRGQEQDHQKRFHYYPLLPGKLANEIQGFFDVVGYLVAEPTEGGGMHRRLWLEPGQTFKAKNRFRDFKDRYIDDPTIADLARLTLENK